MLHAPGMYLTITKEMSQQLQSYLCVNAATERTHVEWEAEDDVSGEAFGPRRGHNCPPEGDSVFVGQKRVASMQLGPKHGRKRDATQLASNGSIQTRAPLKSHAIVHVWHARTCATRESNKFSRQHHLWRLCEFWFVVHARKDVPQVADPLLISMADVNRAHFNRGCSAQCVCPAAGRGLRVKGARYVWKIAKDDVRNLERCSTVDRALRTGLRRRRILTRSGIPVPSRRPCAR